MPVKYGDVVFYVSGSSQSILKAERMVLNSMQRMSAIATKTHSFVKLLEGTNTKILIPVKLRLVSALQRSGP
jgi:nicotinate-nucleotide pyrophosphorylase (carboxylating)